MFDYRRLGYEASWMPRLGFKPFTSSKWPICQTF